MVFLTLPLWIRNRGPDRFWKVQDLLKHARHFRGRKNRCYSLAVRAVRRAFVYATKSRKLKKRNMRTLWISRIAAATREHGMKYPALIHNLTKVVLSLFQRYVGPCGLSARQLTLLFLSHSEQRSAQSTSDQRSGHHRTQDLPVAGKNSKSSAARRLPCRAGRWQRTSWSPLPRCYAAVKDYLSSWRAQSTSDVRKTHFFAFVIT
ncbi:39S ribosomal protein L20, mitochondrial [Oryzias melastigma]|uniref:39S ribosomal protein L20, mitochondrial n=1 Tax=Oryzias melastigma TaxID=30732 RepID=A0A834KXV7_ORYME|nr:39S ribosomal protein L20, mitochondrial [Oryzias melastigma]